MGYLGAGSPTPSKVMATSTHMPWAKRNFWNPLVVLVILLMFRIPLTLNPASKDTEHHKDDVEILGHQAVLS